MFFFCDKICKVFDKEGVDEKVLNDLLFVLVGEWMKLVFLDRDNWLIVFWIEVFKCINRNVKVVFFFVNIDCFIIFFGGYLLDEFCGEGEWYDECFDEEMFVVLGSLEKSLLVILMFEGKYYWKICERIKIK